VLLVDLSGEEDEFTGGVADRMMRAASGRILKIARPTSGP
jgi:hypothetical protein